MGLNGPPEEDEKSRLGPLVDAFARALENTDPHRVEEARQELDRFERSQQPQRLTARRLQLIVGGGAGARRLAELKRELSAVLDEIFDGVSPDDPVEGIARGQALHRRLMRVMKEIVESTPRAQVVHLVAPDDFRDG